MNIIIYTDGSSRGNPGPGGWAAIVRTSERVCELGGRETVTTNNRMEIMAAIKALEWVKENDMAEFGIVINTDSKYLMQGAQSWIAGWKRNGWQTAAKKDVLNRDLWEALASAMQQLSISWNHVDGHAGVAGNERCDEIATTFADNLSLSLYDGPAEKYPLDFEAIVESAVPKKASRSASKGVKAFSYLSVVDGILKKHTTWGECEARVKGVRGARFKKSINPSDEANIIKEWGF